MKSLRVRLSMLKASFLFCLVMLCTVTGSMFTTVAAQDVEKVDKITVRQALPIFVPLKIELFNLDSTDVLQDLEVKVINISKKPIYYLRFEFETVDVKISGAPIAFRLEYGRHELNSGANEDEDQNLKPTDKPVNPNEFIIFKLNKYTLKAHKRNIETGMYQKPSIYKLNFIDLMHGDGTGFTKRGAFKR
jgi:hypothetical protein